MIRCILYPGCRLFVTSGGKEQAASIATEKIQELCSLFPALDREVDYRLKKTSFQKDYVKLVFKNGSTFDVVAARQSARGGRRHGGLIASPFSQRWLSKNLVNPVGVYLKVAL